MELDEKEQVKQKNMKIFSPHFIEALEALSKIGFAIEKAEMMGFIGMEIHCSFVGNPEEK